MPLSRRMLSLWRNLFRKSRVERELNDEVRAYQDMLIEAKVKRGKAPPRPAGPP